MIMSSDRENNIWYWGIHLIDHNAISYKYLISKKVCH